MNEPLLEKELFLRLVLEYRCDIVIKQLGKCCVSGHTLVEEGVEDDEDDEMYDDGGSEYDFEMPSDIDEEDEVEPIPLERIKSFDAEKASDKPSVSGFDKLAMAKKRYFLLLTAFSVFSDDFSANPSKFLPKL